MEVTKNKQGKPWAALFLSLLALLGLCIVLLFFPPGYSFSLLTVKISYVFLFFPLLFLCLYGLAAFFLKSALQGVIIAFLVVIFFIFRLIHLTHPLFYILLFILFLSLEAVVWKKEK